MRPAGADPLGLGTSTWHELLAGPGTPRRRGRCRARRRLGNARARSVPDDDPPDVSRRGEPSSSLTRREREVLALLAEGMSDREVASRWASRPQTVEKHVGAAMRKTGTDKRTAAVVRARSGLARGRV